MNKSYFKLSSKQTLNRDEMKKVTGGNVGVGGTRCVFYCCPSSCSTPFLIVDGITCTSNEQCQSAHSGSGPCESGDYVAALCKG